MTSHYNIVSKACFAGVPRQHYSKYLRYLLVLTEADISWNWKLSSNVGDSFTSSAEVPDLDPQMESRYFGEIMRLMYIGKTTEILKLFTFS